MSSETNPVRPGISNAQPARPNPADPEAPKTGTGQTDPAGLNGQEEPPVPKTFNKDAAKPDEQG